MRASRRYRMGRKPAPLWPYLVAGALFGIVLFLIFPRGSYV